MIDKHFTAFPITSENGANSGMPGMTLRDYFAAKALSGLSANISTNRWGAAEIARVSYMQADEMMKAREV